VSRRQIAATRHATLNKPPGRADNLLVGMPNRTRGTSRGTLATLVVLTAMASLAAPLASAGQRGRGDPRPSGGAGLGGLDPNHTHHKIPRPPGKHARGTWLHEVTITEYWPAPERWFIGRQVRAPGLRGKHRIDWLYSANGVSMEGEGLGLDGRMYHIDGLGDGGWVTRDGTPTSSSDGWAAGPPFWRAGAYWRNRGGGVTFPLAAGGWYAGQGRRYVPLPGVSFATGASLPLRLYRSIAVDPAVIPLGSRVYIPAYRHDGYGGWFVAQDTGGAITGHHVDVYRTPPASPSDGGQYLTGERVFVVKARH
jgi:3D (Asp-Asp-Asp) domain-containing protein